jgi:hypothetical protein
MNNWAQICSELKALEKKVDLKIARIYSENPYPTLGELVDQRLPGFL